MVFESKKRKEELLLPRQQGVTLHVKFPPKGLGGFSWQDLRSDKFPPYSIALDGFVEGPPAIDPSKPCANFNHHEGVVRFATRATCEQVRVALNMGLYDKLFRKNGRPFAHVDLNDGDQDATLSWYQLSRYPNLDGPLMTRLVNVQGLLDMSAGSYPIHPDSSILREFAWIFDPYVRARMENRLGKLGVRGTKALIEEVCGRIDEYMLGRGKETRLDTRYRVLREGTGWKMVEMVGYYARLKMRKAGIMIFASYRGKIGDCFQYSIGTEPFTNARLPELCEKLSMAEPDGRTWGGGDIIVASPRVIGSTLDPDRFFTVTENHFKTL